MGEATFEKPLALVNGYGWALKFSDKAPELVPFVSPGGDLLAEFAPLTPS